MALCFANHKVKTRTFYTSLFASLTDLLHWLIDTSAPFDTHSGRTSHYSGNEMTVARWQRWDWQDLLLRKWKRKSLVCRKSLIILTTRAGSYPCWMVLDSKWQIPPLGTHSIRGSEAIHSGDHLKMCTFNNHYLS